MMRRAAKVMRHWPGPARWLVAELIPFGCLFVGMLLLWAGTGPVGFLGPVGLVLALFGSPILATWYLNWVQDTHVGWVFPLIGLLIPATWVGIAIFGHALSHGSPLVVTPTYWKVFGGLLAALAVTVALAVVNGERHHGRYSYIVME